MLKPKKRLTRREIKEDKLVTAWFTGVDYVSEHSQEILYGVVGVIAIVAGLFWYNQHTAGQEQEASVLFLHGKAAYDNQNYDAAVDSLVKLVNDYGGAPSAGVGTIYLANTFMQKKDYEVAERYYRTYLDDYDDDPILSIAAVAGVAATHEERGEYAKAGELYEKAAYDYDDSYRAPEFLIRAARCYELAEMPEATRKALDVLMEKYPDSEFVEDAKLLKAEMQS